MTSDFLTSASLLLVLLNPFLMTTYLLDLVRKCDTRTFAGVIVRAALISGVVFTLFAWTGDAIFKNLLHVRFASFLIFGGIIFLIIGIRFVTLGPAAIEELRGSPKHLAGSIAMPFMIGPGTVNASVLTGARLPPLMAMLAVAAALTATVVVVISLKYVHDLVKTRYEALVTRYVDIVGRISALLIGTIAVDMILRGIELWIGRA